MTPGELMEALESIIDRATDDGCRSEPKGTDELRKALQALADVRTLDLWAQENKKPATCVPVVDMGGYWRVYLTHAQSFLGSTPDEARAKAAAWVRGLK